MITRATHQTCCRTKRSSAGCRSSPPLNTTCCRLHSRCLHLCTALALSKSSMARISILPRFWRLRPLVRERGIFRRLSSGCPGQCSGSAPSRSGLAGAALIKGFVASMVFRSMVQLMTTQQVLKQTSAAVMLAAAHCSGLESTVFARLAATLV